MKRWWPVFFLIVVWGAVFLIPRTRDHARWLYKKCTANGLFVNGSVFTDPKDFMWPTDDYPELYRKLLVQHPGNKDLRVALALERSDLRDRKPLEQLARRYPTDPLPLAIELRDCFSSLADGRVAGPLTNPNYPGKPPEQKPMTAADKAVFREAILVARHGQRLDPNNTYFDWYLIYALLALRRDKEALDALAVAAHKTGYNDFGYADCLARYNARSLERSQSPMEAVSLASGATFGFMARARQTARFVMELSIAARQRGDKGAAVRYGYDLMRLSRPMRTESQTLIGVLVARAIENIAILAVQTPPGGVRRARVATLSRPDNLAGLAASAGERKFAAEVMAEWGILQKWRAVKWPFEEVAYGVPASVFHGFCLLDESAYFLFVTTRWMLLLWLLLLAGPFLLRRRVFGGGVVASHAAVWGGIAGLLSMAVTVAADVVLEARADNDLGSWLSGYYGGSGLTKYAPWWGAGFSVLSVIGTGLLLASLWQRSRRSEESAPSHDLDTLGAKNVANVALQRFFPLVAKSTLLLIVLGGLVGYFGFLPVNEDNFQYSSYLLVFLCVGLWVLQIITMLRRPHRREALGMMLVALRGAMGGYLLVMWLCMGLVILATLPGLREFDAQFQRTMREGEVKQLRIMVGW